MNGLDDMSFDEYGLPVNCEDTSRMTGLPENIVQSCKVIYMPTQVSRLPELGDTETKPKHEYRLYLTHSCFIHLSEGVNGFVFVLYIFVLNQRWFLRTCYEPINSTFNSWKELHRESSN